ncbi:uncharacterized protein LOC142826075 isoform X2 [Pelodiscus sinensis]|uniref:uncharacterized protein LOC142826075 isoform X2 n=1 Tax=Pelodiscus sinensis TaxID=13735 RepID=UPI003F6ADF02
MAPLALLLVLWLCPGPQGLDPLDPGLLAQGRARLQEAQLLAQHPQLGACWAGALGRLDVGCQELDEEQQSRIALAFAHCHLQRSGRPFPPCEAGSSVRACTQHMDPVAFGVYTEFFTHAHSLCYLLRGEAWRRRAQRTAHRLVASSEGVSARLEETKRLAEQAARGAGGHPALPGGDSPPRGAAQTDAAGLLHGLILLALVAVNVYLERTLSGLVLENAEASSDPTEALARWVGLCRRLCAGAGLAVLAYCTLTYRDVAQQSRELLRGLQETRAQMQDILQETERLLAQRGQKPSQDSMEFVDSGFPEPLSQPERGAPWGPGAEGRTSSPKPRSGSPARQRARLQRRPSRRDSEPHDNPPPWDRLCRYDLRRRPSLQLPPR